MIESNTIDDDVCVLKKKENESHYEFFLASSSSFSFWTMNKFGIFILFSHNSKKKALPSLDGDVAASTSGDGKDEKMLSKALRLIYIQW